MHCNMHMFTRRQAHSNADKRVWGNRGEMECWHFDNSRLALCWNTLPEDTVNKSERVRERERAKRMFEAEMLLCDRVTLA